MEERATDHGGNATGEAAAGLTLAEMQSHLEEVRGMLRAELGPKAGMLKLYDEIWQRICFAHVVKRVTFCPEEDPCCPQCGFRLEEERGCLFCDNCGWVRRLDPQPKRRLGASEIAGLSKWG